MSVCDKFEASRPTEGFVIAVGMPEARPWMALLSSTSVLRARPRSPGPKVAPGGWWVSLCSTHTTIPSPGLSRWQRSWPLPGGV